MTLRDQLARFHSAIVGQTSLRDATDLVERGDIDEYDRLRVYEHAYTARIAGVLVHDYPKLAKLVGEDAVRAWTAPYLRAHPPSSFSLREVGVHLARWLLESHDDRAIAPLFADLARLERARTEVFDGPDAPSLARDDLASMDPAEFPSLELRLLPSSRVVSIASNADAVWDAIENAIENAVPVALAASDVVPTSVIVWRRDLVVIHRTLDADEARVVPTMIEGTTFSAACELVDEATAAERAIELLVRWLDAGILRRC
jgi:hypothetical protein